MKQTKLQLLCERKAIEIREAVEDAICAGAKIEFSPMFKDTCSIDGIYVQRQESGVYSILLEFLSFNLDAFFEPSLQDLKDEAIRKRRELEEIEKQIKEKEAQQ